MSNWEADAEENRKAFKQELGVLYKALVNKLETDTGTHIYWYSPLPDPYGIEWPFDARPSLDEAEWFYENDPDVSTAILFDNRPFTIVQERS